MIPCFCFTCAILRLVTRYPYFSFIQSRMALYVAPFLNPSVSISYRLNSTRIFFFFFSPLESKTTVSTFTISSPLLNILQKQSINIRFPPLFSRDYAHRNKKNEQLFRLDPLSVRNNILPCPVIFFDICYQKQPIREMCAVSSPP